jgi:hypothetical protein
MLEKKALKMAKKTAGCFSGGEQPAAGKSDQAGGNHLGPSRRNHTEALFSMFFYTTM